MINFKNTIQDLILDAINGYLTVINYEKSLEATKKNFDSVNKAYEETKTRFDLGTATLYDLQNAEASFTTSKSNLYAAEQNVKISKKTFQRIVGLKPHKLEEIVDIDNLMDLEEIYLNAESKNLDLKFYDIKHSTFVYMFGISHSIDYLKTCFHLLGSNRTWVRFVFRRRKA